MNSRYAENHLEEEEFINLHKKYKETKDKHLRNKLVMNFMYIPQAVAVQLRGIASGYAQIDDMVNQGVIALMDCIDKFDSLKGVKFETYAFMRVRGSIIDLVRKQDWIPRRVRSTAKEIKSVYSELCSEFMREPTQQEIADKMNITVEKLSQYNGEIANSVTISFEELIQNIAQMGDIMASSEYDDVYPEKSLLKSEMVQILSEAIESLSERERLVVTLYYYENLMFSDIAKVLEVSPQRISQLHTRAILKMRQKIEAYVNELV